MDIKLNLKGFITQPAVTPPTQYYIIGIHSPLTVPTLDFSTGIPNSKPVTLVGLQTDNKGLPIGVTVDVSVQNYITFKIQTTDKKDKGEFDLKVRATFAGSTNEGITFKVYMMEVKIAVPSPSPITYTVQAPQKDTDIDKFVLSSDPDPPGYWGTYSLKYELLLDNYDPLPVPTFVAWNEGGVDKNKFSG